MGILRRLTLRGRTVRLRFTLLYAAAFLVSGIGLLALTNLLTLGRVTESAPVQNPPVEPPGLAAAQQRVHELEAQLSNVHVAQSRQLLAGSLVALGVMVVVSIVLGKIVAGRVLRPLRTITAATQRISAENLHERLGVTNPSDEVKDLADTVDELLERLEASFAAQRAFVANASHELRTPLSTMRASLDVALAKPEPAPPQTVALADRLRTELDRTDRLLEGLLDLARTQHGALGDRATISLGVLASEAVAARTADMVAANLTVDADVQHPGWTHGSPTLLSRIVENVVDNAIVHNQHGGWIRIATEEHAAWARLVVETGGPVLDDEHVARLAQPFQRLGTDRTGSDTGSGLGLSIVAAIATAHGGRLDLHARPEGGLRVTVSMPLVAAPEGVPA